MIKIIVVDVDKILKPPKVHYNKSIQEIEHSDTRSPFPIKPSFEHLDNARFKSLKEAIEAD